MSTSSGTGARMSEMLDEVAGNAENLRPAWVATGELWAERERSVFATEGRGAWPPLKPETIERKAREGTTEPLIATGTLFREVTRAEPRAAGEHFVVHGPARGSQFPYVRFHLRGEGVPKRNPAPRLTAGERDRFIQAVRDHLAPSR